MVVVGVETTCYESLVSLIAWDNVSARLLPVILVTMLRHKDGELIVIIADLVNYNSCLHFTG